MAWWVCDGIWPAALICSYAFSDPPSEMLGNGPAYIVSGLRDMFQKYEGKAQFDKCQSYGHLKLYLRKDLQET